MKKIGCFILFLTLAGTLSFSEQATIYLEGVGTQEQVSFFNDAFVIEIPTYGYKLVDRSDDAEYTIRYVIMPQNRMFVMEASIIRMVDRFTLASNAYYFEYLEDMYPYNQLLIFTLVNNIPRDETTVTVAEDESWRNKWLYIRASVDFPINFYTLLPTGLYKSIAVTDGTYDSETEEWKNVNRVAPIDNRVVAKPAATLGIEIQVINWLSIEPYFQAAWDHMNERHYLSFAAGLELKFPLKFVRHIMLEPYLAGLYTLPFNFLNSVNDIITPSSNTSPSKIAAGVGIQLSIKRGKSDAIFLDLGYWRYMGDAIVKNNYGDLYPNPAEIHFQRSVVRLGVGYKFGLFNRK